MNFTERKDPITLFGEWLDDARSSEPNDPNAVALASVDQHGMPDVRMVLLKDFDEAGFVFYTNFESAKGLQVNQAMKAAMCFHWKSLRRQVRLRGPVEIVSDGEADAYFQSRHPQSRLGAWASDQSRPLDSRETLINRVEDYRARYGEQNIPRPPHWSGFRIKPQSIEFWQDGEFRLHDRVQFVPDGDQWTGTRLYP